MNKFFMLVFSTLLFGGCLQTIAIRSFGGIMDYGFEVFNEESDLELARAALGSNLKLLDALNKADPQNGKLLLLAAQGYNAYALAFAEDDSVERAREFYLRGREYGLRLLSENAKLKASIAGDLEGFQQALKSFSKADVPALFWTALSWGSYINLTRTDPAALADLPKVSAMMEFVLNHDSTYYYGGAHLYFGSAIASTPMVLGGKPEVAKAHFEQCLALNGGKFLMAYVYYAKTYCVQIQDQKLFESFLKKVDETSLAVLPEARFVNAVAKKKAKLLLAKMNELF